MSAVIRNVTVVDPETRTMRPGRSLIVEDGVFVGEVAAGQEPYRDDAGPGETAIIDAGGSFAVPGLIDAHIHLRVVPHVGPRNGSPTPSLLPEEAADIPLNRYAARAQTFLYCGVTSVYDAGNDPDMIFALRRRERAGAADVPRIHATGRLLCAPGGHGAAAGVPVAEGVDVEQIVAQHAAHRPDLVKITFDEHGWGVRPLVPLMSETTLRRTIDAVHATGRKVTVHVSSELRARQAVDAGADVLAHPVIQSPMNESFAHELAAAGIPVVTTLTIGDRYARLADDPDYVDGPLYRECETLEERARLRTEESRTQRANRWADWMRVMTPVAQENLRMLTEAGAIVAAGTDQSFGPDYHRELELLAAAGIGGWDVLCAATTGPAAAIDRRGELGTFRPGACADVLLVHADPIADIGALTRIEQVIKDGVRIDRSALDIPGNRKTS